MHPANKKHYMIDYMVMRASQRRLCTDVQVMRGANCWTDHLMVRAKVCIDLAPSGSAKGKSSIPFAVHDLGNRVKADAYCKCPSDHLKETPQNLGMSAEWNWRNLKLSVVKASESTLGRTSRKQPDWFMENGNILVPLAQKKNEAHEKMLQNNNIKNW